MPPDEHTRKIIGAMGGTLLGACAMPQIIRLIRTKSASDISYVFLLAYILGLFLTFLYLFWKRALITWICILIQLGSGVVVLLGKVYLEVLSSSARKTRREAREQRSLARQAQAGIPGSQVFLVELSTSHAE
uniref:Uncharacterized protein n=1 Tax=Auxenochlorella protothecoides TaxID=3075 RepID=A0A1D1ZRB4_AUXPR